MCAPSAAQPTMRSRRWARRSSSRCSIRTSLTRQASEGCTSTSRRPRSSTPRWTRSTRSRARRRAATWWRHRSRRVPTCLSAACTIGCGDPSSHSAEAEETWVAPAAWRVAPLTDLDLAELVAGVDPAHRLACCCSGAAGRRGAAPRASRHRRDRRQPSAAHFGRRSRARHAGRCRDRQEQ